MQDYPELRTLEKFREVNREFPKNRFILEHKAQGKKVFGWLCTYVPEEVIHAAGILPVRIVGYSEETDLTEGTAYMHVNNCSFSRSCLELGLKGEYSFLDGVVGGSTCDGARRLFDLWRHYIGTPFHHVLTVPRKYTERAHRLYYEEVEEFTRHLEEFIGRKVTDEALLASIGLYNETRHLLSQLYGLRRRDNPPITGAETMDVLNASFRMPREVFNSWLRELLAEIEDRRRDVSGKYRARLMLIGSVLTNTDFIRSIERQGGIVVTDELCTSTRYWTDPVVLKDGLSPLEAIARRYLGNFPCARMFPSEERFNRIVEFAREYRVDGVVSQIVRYCVPYCHDLPLLTKRLREVNVPVLALDVEYGSSGSGQIATRVQAFLEMLEARNGIASKR
ncbi:MAG: 2-hydroxyacyl-CoA dehydratase family protein [Dehalococcoidales bacterium]|nr:2-hydroxyacyl-CoA dehydratase family protein [Dehalococcoidales bacterium]